MTAPILVHATAVLLGSTGVLLRGPSGSGKSLLALALLEHWETRGLEAFLVADDQVGLDRTGTGVRMAAPARLAGLMEPRFRGLIARPHRSPADLHLVVDLVPDLVRLPDANAFAVELLGVMLARAPVPQCSLLGLGHQVLLVAEAIKALGLPSR